MPHRRQKITPLRQKVKAVRPVRQPKAPKLMPPPRKILIAAYRGYISAASAQRIDNLIVALRWFEDALYWLKEKRSLSLDELKLVDKAIKLHKLGMGSEYAAKENTTERESAFVMAVKQYEKIIVPNYPTKMPLIADTLAAFTKAKSSLEKKKTILTKRNINLLGMIGRAIEPKMTDGKQILIQIVPNLRGHDGRKIQRKFDHELHTMFYSQKHVRDLRKMFRVEGFFPVIIQEMYFLTRQMAMKQVDGNFELDNEVQLQKTYECLMQLCEWAKQPTSTRRLIKQKRLKMVKVPCEKGECKPKSIFNHQVIVETGICRRCKKAIKIEDKSDG